MAFPTMRTRLACEQLDDRCVPSVTQTFTFTLPNGDVGGGSFTLPVEQVDSSLGSQQITIGDLTVTLDGETFNGTDFDGGATADFVNGAFQGVLFEVDSPPAGFPYTDLAVGDGLAQVIDSDFHYTMTPVTYPESDSGLPDTAVLFVLPGGGLATGSFTMPVAQIDSSQASQQLPISDLIVTIGGSTFTGTDFTSAPTAEFANGVFLGVTFTINSLPAGFAYTSVSVSDAVVTATDTASNVVTATAVYAAPPGVAVPEPAVVPPADIGEEAPLSEVEAELAAYVEAGGTYDLLYQTAANWDSSSGTGAIIDIDGTPFEASPNLLTYAKATAPPDRTKPLNPVQLSDLRTYLEALVSPKPGQPPLKQPQLDEMNALLDQLQKYGYEGSSEQTLKDLNRLLAALSKVVSQPAPPVGKALELYTKFLDAIIDGVSGGIVMGEYNNFKELMDKKPANKTLKEYYEEIQGGFRPPLVDKYYILYQAKILKDRLDKSTSDKK